MISRMYANAGCDGHRSVNTGYDVIEIFVNAGCDVIGVCEG